MSRAVVPTPEELRVIATDIAREAGELLTARLHDDRSRVGTKSTATDMVTEMDEASERLIVDRLLAVRPDDAVLGEEGADRPGTTGVTWVVDPLDGTTNYLYRIPGWNVAIGAEIDGTPVAGAVVVPGHGDVFSATVDGEATHNGTRVTLGEPPPLAEALLGTGFAYDRDTRRRQAEILTRMLPAIRDIRRVGAAAADLCAVACGRLDAFAEAGLGPWDRCAGTVIARAAGARVEDFEDTPLPGVLTVAAHPDLWADLLDLLRSAGALGTPG